MSIMVAMVGGMSVVTIVAMLAQVMITTYLVVCIVGWSYGGY